MKETLSVEWMTAEQEQRISEAIEREQPRLRNFIRRRVSDPGDAEDILQEVFYELVEAYRMMKPIEQVGAWLFRGARNRIIDLFHKKKPGAFISAPISISDDEEATRLQTTPPPPNAGLKHSTPRSHILQDMH